ncbi:putative sodium-coupled neutral amino acid transporter 10 isoform X2 [Chrysoperla carnea]|nr:putative sodium-coupled neutral amino acid transporter 10 isoform X2 [Chrysoperla carnea]
MLLISSVISRFACHFLLKSAIMARRRTFEFLAFHAFGPAGKFFVEIGIIGFLLGTCIAFFVVVGDLGPAIIANILNISTPTETLRSTVIITLAIFCVLPLGLLKNVDSLSSVCTATVGFYFCLVIKIIIEALPHILYGDWTDRVEFWRPAGILQCLPIFSMALFCQTQLFEIFDILPNASLESMNSVVRGAVNICTAVYVFVGVFGYIAFCTKPFSGNILMSFAPSMTTDAIKIGFVFSVAFSFPMVIFPCRASLHSLLFRKAQIPHEAYGTYIPEHRFRWLTVLIVVISCVTGLLIPSIELVLGLVGSTIGVMICVLFPATCFICMTTKNTNERIVAQIMLSIGILVMVLGTYANLYAMDEASSVTTLLPKTDTILNNKPEMYLALSQDKINNPIAELKETDRNIPPSLLENIKIKLEQNKIAFNKNKTSEIEKIKIEKNQKEDVNIVESEVRHEPPQPVEPEEVHEIKEPEAVHDLKDALPEMIIDKIDLSKNHLDNKKVDNSVAVNDIKLSESQIPKIIEADQIPKLIEIKKEIEPEVIKKEIDSDTIKKEENKENIKKEMDLQQNIKKEETDQEALKKEEVDQEAIKKEDREIAEETKVEQSTVNAAQQLFEKLKAQGQEQEKVLQEAKQVLAEIKEQKEELERKQQIGELEKKKAALEIQKIANIAIETLSKSETELKNLKIDTINEIKDKKIDTISKNENNIIKNNENPPLNVDNEVKHFKSPVAELLLETHKNNKTQTLVNNDIELVQNRSILMKPIPLIKNDLAISYEKKIDSIKEITSNKEINLNQIPNEKNVEIKPKNSVKIEIKDNKLPQIEIKKVLNPSDNNQNTNNEIKHNLNSELKLSENLPKRDILSQDTTLNTNKNIRNKRDVHHANRQRDICDINQNIETDLLKESK